jgi:hypothetical protein
MPDSNQVNLFDFHFDLHEADPGMAIAACAVQQLIIAN